MSGVAIGTKMGPSYACLFMGLLEHTLLKQYKKPAPEIYKRYIDDGIGATSLSYNQLLDFIYPVYSMCVLIYIPVILCVCWSIPRLFYACVGLYPCHYICLLIYIPVILCVC